MVTKIDASMFDAQGKEIILDADADTSITADTDDQIDIKIGGADIFQMTATALDINGKELILDADADTSITADTDDQIDIRIAGADDFRFTANNMNVLSGSTLTIDSGATITNSGTATGFADFTAIGDGSVGAPSLANSGDTNTGIYFPAADTVGVVAGGTEQFRFGSNPIPGGSKNLIINGQMHVKQRSDVPAGTFTGLGTGTSDQYTLDRWSLSTIDTSTARWTVSKESSGGTSGKDPWLKCLNTTADASPGAGEGQLIQQKMEGIVARPLLGNSDGIIDGFTVSADMILYKDGSSSISFPATVSCVAYTNDVGRGCIIDATITAAATWQRVEFVFPADTSGTFNIDNTWGFRVGFGLYAGTSRDAADGSWFSAATNAGASEDAENIADATGNYIGFTNVQLEVGSIATSFEYEQYVVTLEKCQRYFEQLEPYGSGYNVPGTYNVFAATTSTAQGHMNWNVEKRAAPTIDMVAATDWVFSKVNTSNNNYSGGEMTASAFTFNSIQAKHCMFLITTTATGLTAGHSVPGLQSSGANHKITVSAEL